jgi:hypothetical protein
MKLIIDRGSTRKDFYTIQFGPDFDIAIFIDAIWIGGTSKETLSEIDKIITKSAELKWCVLYIKHPLLLEHDNEVSKSPNGFFVDENARHVLRSYFALRLIHRRHSVELIEIGRRLF